MKRSPEMDFDRSDARGFAGRRPPERRAAGHGDQSRIWQDELYKTEVIIVENEPGMPKDESNQDSRLPLRRKTINDHIYCCLSC